MGSYPVLYDGQRSAGRVFVCVRVRCTVPEGSWINRPAFRWSTVLLFQPGALWELWCNLQNMALISGQLLSGIARMLWFECFRVKKWLSAISSSSEKLYRPQNMTVLSDNSKNEITDVHQTTFTNQTLELMFQDEGLRSEQLAPSFFSLFSLWWWTTEAFIFHYFSLYLYCSFVLVSLVIKESLSR